MGVITGAYRCKAGNRTYFYDATWSRHGNAVVWDARIIYDRRSIAASESTPVQAGDEGASVKRALETWIERFSCSAARAGHSTALPSVDPAFVGILTA